MIERLPRHMANKIRVGDACWIWTGALSSGYGITSVDGKTRLAHRAIYEILVGPIPLGLQLDHVKARGCRSRACVNPAHLEPVTCLVNNQRSNSPPANNARKTHCIRGHEFTPDNTYRVRGGRMCKQCSRETQIARRARLKSSAIKAYAPEGATR